MRLLTDMRSRALAIVRRGPHEVVWTPEFMGLGNLLYLAMWVAQERENRSMLRTPALEQWLDVFPALRELTVLREDVAFTAMRRSAVRHSYGRFGDDFSPCELTAFIRAHLTNAGPREVEDRLVVNVRRGDYFSDPSVRGYFGFDQDAYLRQAVAAIHQQETIQSVLVVSDGIGWCRDRLGWLDDFATDVRFASGSTPADDFWTVATSRRILMTNSTFSYWAAHVHDVLLPDGAAHVWAPAFFSRWQPDHRSWGLDPRWSVVQDIPGGWDS